MALSVIPSVRTVLGSAETGLAVVNLNFPTGTVLTLASPGSKSAVLFTTTDGMVEITADTQCWYTVAGVSALGTTAGAGVAVAGSALLPQGQTKQLYMPVNSILGAIAYSSGNLSVIPAFQTT